MSWTHLDDEGGSSDGAILVIYTGGTIGSTEAATDTGSIALDVAPWEKLERHLPVLAQLRRGLDLRIHVVTLDRPFDSADLVPNHWCTLVDVISHFYDRVLGFVILHGTDTMSYTASALSFMLPGLDKPVVLTGAVIPAIGRDDTDGLRNLSNAIRVAAWRRSGVPNVGEVCIAFGSLLARGNRARKLDADSRQAFGSPNYPPLGTFVGDRVVIHTGRRYSDHRGFCPQQSIDPRVVSIQIFPGIQGTGLLTHAVMSDAVRAAVIQTYGSGNAPTDTAFLAALEAANAAGKIVIDVTGCAGGSVRLFEYRTGVELAARGVLSGADMTPEAALCKLMVLLGRSETTIEETRADAQRCLAGEQSDSLHGLPRRVRRPPTWSSGCSQASDGPAQPEDNRGGPGASRGS